MNPILRMFEDRAVACFPKGEVLDVYFGLDEDAGVMMIVCRDGLKWACEKVVREVDKKYEVAFDESMLKEKILVCLGFQNELEMEHFVGGVQQLRERCMERINQWNDRCMKEIEEDQKEEQREMYEQMIQYLEEDLSNDEWVEDVPISGHYAPSILEYFSLEQKSC